MTECLRGYLKFIFYHKEHITSAKDHRFVGSYVIHRQYAIFTRFVHLCILSPNEHEHRYYNFKVQSPKEKKSKYNK